MKTTPSPDTDTDIRLMLAFRQGDETAFAQLMERHLKSAVNTIYRFVGNRDEADDLAQEAFLRIYTARERYEPTARFNTWLYRIITNLCLNYLRDRRKRRVQSLYVKDGSADEVPREIKDTAQDTPSQIFSRAEVRDRVKAAMETLPPNQRMAVILAKYEGLSYEEIAESMNTTVKAIKSLLNRAKVNLKRKLTLALKDHLPPAAKEESAEGEW